MARKYTRDDVDKLFEYNVDLSSRTVILDDDIHDYSTSTVIKALHVMDRTAGEITIKLCSCGGEWYPGMAVFDAIKACTNQVRIVAMGQAMSMGAVILQAGDVRALMPNTTVMVHYGSDWFGGHTKDLERRADESKRTCIVMEDIFLEGIREKHPTYTREDFKHQFAFDVFMSADEAVALGLADEIIYPTH